MDEYVVTDMLTTGGVIDPQCPGRSENRQTTQGWCRQWRTKPHIRMTMNNEDSQIVITPSTSKPQGSAVVSRFGVIPGPNVVGPLRSSSSDCEDAGVANQALVISLDTANTSNPPVTSPKIDT